MSETIDQGPADKPNLEVEIERLNEAVNRLTDEAAHMRQAIDEEVRCLGHLENELRGRIDGEGALKFFPVIHRAQQRLNEARNYRG